MTTVAVVPAAGSGTRLGAGVPKAFVPLAGRTLLQWSVAGLLASGVVSRVVVVVPADRRDDATAQLGGDVTVVVGGPDRMSSVRLGLAAVPEAGHVLVHDAARALTPPALVARVVAALADEHPAVVPAVPLTDTVKTVDADGTVTGTPPRAGLRAVQTPQGFAVDVLRRAHALFDPGQRDLGCSDPRSHADPGRVLSAPTDDASMVEALGVAVRVVAGDPMAFKITTPLDLRLARAVLADTPLVEPVR